MQEATRAILSRDPYIIHLNIGWFPFIWVETAMFQMGKMYVLRSPVEGTLGSSVFERDTNRKPHPALVRSPTDTLFFSERLLLKPEPSNGLVRER